MASYYYFMSTLPMLSFDRKLPFDWAAFLSLAKGNVGRSDYEALSSLTLQGGGGTPFCRQWAEFYGGFEEALAEGRARARGAQAPGKARAAASDPGAASCVGEALAEENPLKAELLMLRFLFRRAEEMGGAELFGQRALMAYAVKLLILLRKARFSTLDGKAEYERLFSNMRSIVFDTKGKLE